MSSLPETNHDIIQGESYNNSFRQCKYVNSEICNNTYIIIALDNFSNRVTDNNAYPDTKLRRIPSIFIYDINITSYVLNTEANHIILNDIRQFKDSHPCKSNVKGIGGSNVSIRVTGTTYIPIKYNNGTVDHIKFIGTVFVLLSPFNILPPHKFIPALRKVGHKTDCSRYYNIKYIFKYKLPSEGKEKWQKLTIKIS